MYKFKKYLVILLFTVFVFGNFASTAMAYCGSEHNGPLTVSALSDAAHHQMAAMSQNGDTTDKVVKHHNSSDEKSHSSTCFNCYGSLCHSQSLVPYHFALGSNSSNVALHIEQYINQKYIFLTTIPQPPKQLS